MMIETSLIRLDKAVEDGRTLSAGMNVILPIGYEAEVYGFIAIEDNFLSYAIDMPALGECHILSNRAIFLLNNHPRPFPIFKSVCKATKPRYGIYLLYVPKFRNLSSEWDKKFYQESMSKENPNPKVERIDGIKIEEKVAYYYSNEQDLYFESKSKLRGIGSGFVVVTRRVSKQNDDVKYEIFDSHSVMMENEQS